MLKIKALNTEASSDEDTPVIRREAQEEIALELYNKALRLQTDGVFTEAESILCKLIDENIPLLENNGGLPKSMSNLKYSCHVNIGNIYLKLNRVNDALERYLLASELDGTDVTLWHKIGNLSLAQDKFRQSAYAFAKGLECSESHWPCLDKLISVLFAIRDTIACLEYINKAITLDPDYTKGLVLRKQIYRDNPATKDYYKLYNPDSIWEPPLDIPIGEDDEQSFLEEAQVLCNRVTEVEKSFESKPFQTIALPKPLKEFTWLSLTETIVYIHQYLADNEMSHLTIIDMKKCMSHVEEPSVFKLPQTDQAGDSKAVEDKPVDDKTPQVSGEVTNTEEKMDTDQMPERRSSQNSETNVNETPENTPVQTDNDEEQNADQENEEQDETVEPRERGRPRGSKRKRDVISDLRTWGWYSRRKLSKKAKEKDFSVEDALERIIPKDLLPYRIDPDKINNFEDSMNTMDLYHLYIENYNVNYLSPIHSPTSVNYEHYFGTDRELDDVKEFWTKPRDYYDAIVLIKDLVFHLSKLWHYKWPKELVQLYIRAYGMFRQHCDPPQVWCGGHTFEEQRDDALASILFGELSLFSGDDKDAMHRFLLGNLRLISGWQDEWKDEYPSFFIRVYWLQSHLFRKENKNDLSITALELIQEAMEEEELKHKEKYMLSLPNCFKYGLINMEITNKILKHLEMINSLTTVEGLYNAEKYKEVAAILKQTFSGGPCPQVGRMGRPAQLGILMHSLWFTDMGQCFVWTEECLNEAFEQHLKFNKDQDKWEKILEKCLAILYEIIKRDTVCAVDLLEDDKKARIVQTLSKIISKQLSCDGSRLSYGCVTPWILLHFVLLRQEQRAYGKMRISKGKREKLEINSENEEIVENSVPPSVAILFSAHEFLGPKGWCMTNQGELLHFIIDTILDKLDCPIFERMRDKMDVHIEQAMFCLYQHPSKKNKISRHLADHNVDPLPLSWQRACQLFEFYGPDQLPEFNSYKNASISVDLEQLFKRIIALVPPSNALQHHLPKIMDYIHGKTDKILDPVDFPHKVKAIYFLIGDFYFKQREFNKCIKYFQMDLCINPQRLDSWACLGLSYAAQLDAKLNHCEKFKNEMEFLEKAKYASICFKRALELCPDPLMLLIECGTFQYTVHSYCSRVMKFESENLSMERFEFLENQKNSYLDSSGNSFEKAISIYEMEDPNEADERWLQYYILGKIAEKKQKEPTEYLQYYLTATTLLDENKAEYPEKINYNNPQHLSVEALELHYRTHASVLKYLELHEGKDIPNTLGAFFKKCLSTSKFLRKPPPPPPPPPEPTVKPPIELAVEPEIKEIPLKTSNSSSSFQEQFLNSLSKLNAPKLDNKEVANELNGTEPEKTDNKEAKKLERSGSDEKTDIKIDAEKTDVTVDAGNTDTVAAEKAETASAKVAESVADDDVIMIISDSDEDTNQIEDNNQIVNDEKKEVTEKMEIDEKLTGSVNGSNKKAEEEEELDATNGIDTDTEKVANNGAVLESAVEVNQQVTLEVKTEEEEIKKDEKMDEQEFQNLNDEKMDADIATEIKTEERDEKTEEAEGPKYNEVKDVQKLLDEMMMQTMKETEERTNEVDSDMSGTEKVEEVTLKDEQESVDMKIDGKIESVENGREPTESKTDPEVKPKKLKPPDGVIDIYNKKASLEESSSGSSSSSSSSDSSDSDSDEDDDSSSSSSSSSSDGTNEFMSHSEISHMIDKCVAGLEICIIRLTQNYKALYRLAHLYFNYKQKKDMTKCKQLLLSEYKCKDGTIITGLFSDRKPNNFFNGIWRIPSTEIDRPGSLSAHMSRCLSLLMQILRNTNDNKTLIDLCVQLRRTPEPDKIYIKDSERMAFSEQAMTMCVQTLRGQIKDVSNMSNPQIAKLLQEIFKIYQRLDKHAPSKETPFANLLVEVYKKFIKEKIPDNVNVLELATKFCSQNKAAEKHRLQGTMPKTSMFTPRGPGVSVAAPVMPSPQTLVLPHNVPLKRPGTARPRGRPPLQKPLGQPPLQKTAGQPPLQKPAGQPPLQKMPSQPRYQRPKSPSSAGLSKTYAWQKSLMDQSYAYEYLKHYQDELIKQYSQNLSIAQLTQLSQILTQGQINNPLTATAITSQMLAQTGLLNSGLLTQMNSTGTVSTSNASTQLMDSLHQLNPNMKKKLGVDHALSSLTSDQLKLLGTLVPKQPSSGAQSKSSPSHTITSVSGIVSTKHGKQQASVSRQNVSSTSKPNVIVDSSAKHKQTSSTPPPKNFPSSPVFKEPGYSKAHSPEDKTAKDLMKDRPNISITPVAVALPPPPSISPSFMRPTSTSPSSGKTLQEKLAEKKKEQQSKQMKSNGEGEKRHTDALMKSLNIPSLPSSLTVSPAQPTSSSSLIKTPDSSQAGIYNFSKNSASINPQFPLDIGMQPTSSLKSMKEQQPLPASLTVSRASTPGSSMSTPSFPVDSGISISQVTPSPPKINREETSSTNDGKQNTPGIPVSLAVDISPVNNPDEAKNKKIKTDSSTKDVRHLSPKSSKYINDFQEKKPRVSSKQNIIGFSLGHAIDISPVEKYNEMKSEKINETSKKSVQTSQKSSKSSKHSTVRQKIDFSKEKPFDPIKRHKDQFSKELKGYSKPYSSKKLESPKPESPKKLESFPNLETLAKLEPYKKWTDPSKAESSNPKPEYSRKLNVLSKPGTSHSKSEHAKKLDGLSKSGESSPNLETLAKLEPYKKWTDPSKAESSNPKPEYSRKLNFLSKPGTSHSKSEHAKKLDGLSKSGSSHSKSKDSKHLDSSKLDSSLTKSDGYKKSVEPLQSHSKYDISVSKSDFSKKLEDISKLESYKRLESLSRSGISIESFKKTETVPKSMSEAHARSESSKPESRSKSASFYAKSLPKKRGFSKLEMSKRLELLSKSGVHLQTVPKLGSKKMESSSSVNNPGTLYKSELSKKEETRLKSETLQKLDKAIIELPLKPACSIEPFSKPAVRKPESDDDDVICLD